MLRRKPSERIALANVLKHEWFKICFAGNEKDLEQRYGGVPLGDACASAAA